MKMSATFILEPDHRVDEVVALRLAHRRHGEPIAVDALDAEETDAKCWPGWERSHE
jgi:hypothetical protein